MGRPKTPKVQYIGPSAAEIQAQSAQQQAQLEAQRQLMEAQFGNQLAQIQSAYGNQINTLGKQQQMQLQQYQKEIDNLTKEQARRDAELKNQTSLIENLKNGVLGQQSLLSTIQQQEQMRLGQTQQDVIGSANQRYQNQQARTAYRQQASNRGGTGILSSLLRNTNQPLLS